METSLGPSGISLALGVYKSVTFKNIDSRFRDLVGLVETQPSSQRKQQIVEPLATAVFDDFEPIESKTNAEIHKLQDDISKISTLTNDISIKSTQNSPNETITGDELDELSVFGPKEFVDVRSRVTNTETDNSARKPAWKICKRR